MGEWNQLAVGFDDASLEQIAEYPQVRSRGGTYWRLIVKNQCVVAALCVVRVYRVPLLPIGIAVVAAGPLWLKKGVPANLRVLQETIRMIRERVCGQGFYLVIRPALYSSDQVSGAVRNLFRAEGFSENRVLETTPLMDISKNLPVIRTGLDQKWRNRLVVSEREGMVITITSQESSFQDFLVLYEETRRRKSFRNAVHPKTFWKAFRHLNESMRPSVALCWKNGHPVSGALVSFLGGTARYLYGGSTQEGLKCSASNLLQWTIVDFAKKQGCTRYDLGGVSETAPWFKRGLCGKNGSNIPRISTFSSCGSRINRWIFELLRLRRSVK